MWLVAIRLAQISIKLIKQISKIGNISDDNKYRVEKNKARKEIKMYL